MLREIQIRKFSALKDHHQTTKTSKAIHGSEKFVTNLSEHVLAEMEESVLKKGLHLGPETGTSSIDLAQLSRFYLKTDTDPVSENLCSEK
jgi:hypothetical protein